MPVPRTQFCTCKNLSYLLAFSDACIASAILVQPPVTTLGMSILRELTTVLHASATSPFRATGAVPLMSRRYIAIGSSAPRAASLSVACSYLMTPAPSSPINSSTRFATRCANSRSCPVVQSAA